MNDIKLSEDELQTIHQLIQGAGGGFDFNSVIKGVRDNGWVVHPVYYNGCIVGGIMQKGAEIHTSIAPEFQRKWNPRPYINSILYPALEKYGEIISLADKNDKNCLNWLMKLGFSVTSEDSNYFHLKLTEIKFKYKK